MTLRKYSLCAASAVCGAAILFPFLGPPLVGQGEKPLAPTLAALTQPIDVLDADKEGLQKALEKRVTLDLQKTPLFKAVGVCAAQLDVNVCVDLKRLEEEMVDPDSPITLKVHDVRARNAFALMLEPLHLVCVPVNGVLKITRSLDGSQIIRFYPVADLVVVPERMDTIFAQLLIAALQETVDREVWEPNGGDCTIRFFPPSMSLVVACSDPVHERVYAMLTTLRVARARFLDLYKGAKIPSAKEMFDRSPLLAGGWPGEVPSAAEVLRLLATKPGQPPASADKVAAEAKRIAEAALQLTLRLEMQLSQKQPPPKPTEQPSAPGGTNGS